MPKTTGGETPEKREKRLIKHVETVMTEQRAEAAAELEAMDIILGVLHPLPQDSQTRTLRWVADRLDNFTPPIATFIDSECPF